MFYLFLAIYVVIMFFIPILILRKKLCISFSEDNNIALNIITIIGLSIIYSFLCGCAIKYYSSSLDTSFLECSNTGGWTQRCSGDDNVALITFSITFIITIVYYFLCENEIYKIFSSNNKFIKYFILILYLLFLIYISFVLFISFFGMFTSYDYSYPVSLFRWLVTLLPCTLFGFSTYGRLLVNKLKGIFK